MVARLSIALVVAVLGAGAVPAAVTGDTPDVTGAFLHDDDAIRSVPSPEFSFVVATWSDTNKVGLTATKSSPHTVWTFEFAAPPGEALSVGTYTHAANAHVTRGAGVPGIYVTGEGRGCSDFDATFTVTEIAWDGAALSRLAVDFVDGCDYAMSDGEVRYHSTQDLYAWWFDRGPYSGFGFGSVVMPNTGDARSLFLINEGTQPIQMAAEVGGDNPADFPLVSVGGCLAAPIAVGASCELQVRFKPTARGERKGSLRFWDEHFPAARRPILANSLYGIGMQTTQSFMTSLNGSYPTGVAAYGRVDPPEAGGVYFVEGNVALSHRQDLQSGYVVDLAPGTHSVFGRYVGSQVFVASDSAPMSVTVPFVTVTDLTSYPSVAVAGDLIELYATVASVGSYRLTGGTLSIVDLDTNTEVASAPISNNAWDVTAYVRSFEAHVGHYIARHSGFGLATASSDSVAVTVNARPAGDTLAPSGSVLINSGNNHTNSANVNLDLTASDLGGSGLSQMSFSTGNADSWSAWQPFATTASATIGGSDGAKSLFVRYRDGAGNISQPASDTIVLDRVSPTVSVPTVEIIDGGTLGKTIPVRVAFTASDVTSSVASLELTQSVNGGPFASVGQTISAQIQLAIGSSRYQFRGRATDQASNTGINTSASVVVKTVQDRAATVSYSGTWKSASKSKASGGKLRSTTSVAKATLTFSGRCVSWISQVGPAGGKAGVYLDGVLAEIVDLYAPTVGWKRLSFAVSTTSGQHTLEIRALHQRGAQSSGYRVVIDAFVVVQ